MDELAPDVRRDLRGLSKEGAEFVAQHLVAAGTLADEQPAEAWVHARAARSKGGRIAVVRETVGLVAYRAAEWAEAISELRAARRMGGGPGHLAVMADCERALGHPEKAIELSRSAEAEQLDEDGKIELTVVVAGARADLGQVETALVVLENSGLQADVADPRLLYAYADLLVAADRRPEALDWFMKAYDADVDDDTDAAERIAELTDEVVTPDDDDTEQDDDTGQHDDTEQHDDTGQDDDTEQDLVEIDDLPAVTDGGEARTADAPAADETEQDDAEQSDSAELDDAEKDGSDQDDSPVDAEAPTDGQLPFFSDPLFSDPQFSDTDGPNVPDDRR